MQTSLYIEQKSLIHRLHPVVKLFALFIIFWSAFWVDQPLVLAPLAIAMVVLARVSGAWQNFYAFRWFMLLMIPPTMIQWMVVYRQGPALVHLGFIHLSLPSLLFGFGKGLKLAELLAGSILFLSTTTIEEFSTSLVSLRVPYRVAFAMSLAFRLVPLFMDSALTVVQAQGLRGYDFNRGNLFERMRRYVPTLIPVFMGALRRVNNMAMALEARGFGMGAQPTSLGQYEVRALDCTAFAILLAVGVLYFLFYLGGYGTIATK
ncbi:MAG TPA: energy-coupling factor transporter transmembrane component T [Candidatus Binataceae bacterium]|nr:energy-coupling factor transporter transmembrane component T [Candidatus Binataceae bacterium]